MVKVIGVKFSKIGKIYDFKPDGFEFQIGDFAICETTQGLEAGKVIYINKEIKSSKGIKSVLRKATAPDLQKIRQLNSLKKKAISVCQKFITQHNLEMKLIDGELSFDEKRLTFYFIAETRVDFRELVKDLARHFKKQIRLQQIGPRDEVRFFEDLYGICGQPVCCVRFLSNLGSITMDMARLQGISGKGISKISGNCGRLMCCLAYEEEQYKKLLRKLPKVGSKVKTKKGIGEVTDLDILTQRVEVTFNNKDKIEFNVDEITKIKR